MKKISASYWIFAALCFLWGCVDLYAQAILEGFIASRHDLNTALFFLASGSWVLSVGKILLAPLLLVWGRRMAKKKEGGCPAPRLLPWFARRVGLVMLGLWLLTMSLLTVGTAQYILKDLVAACEEYPKYVDAISDLGRCYPTEEGEVPSSYRQWPGGIDYCMLRGISQGNLYVNSPSLNSYPDGQYNTSSWRGIYSNILSTRLKTAVLFLDSEENVLHQSGNFFYFQYLTASNLATRHKIRTIGKVTSAGKIPASYGECPSPV